MCFFFCWLFFFTITFTLANCCSNVLFQAFLCLFSSRRIRIYAIVFSPYTFNFQHFSSVTTDRQRKRRLMIFYTILRVPSRRSSTEFMQSRTLTLKLTLWLGLCVRSSSAPDTSFQKRFALRCKLNSHN